MKRWNFKVKSNPHVVSKHLESAFKSVSGLVFHINHDKKNSITFKMRKRILYGWYLMFLNSIIVKGTLTKTETEDETNVEISFNQHFLWKFILFTDMIVALGFLIIIISGKYSSAYMYLFGAIILVIGIILWIKVQKKYERDIQEYKTLISQVLEF